MNLVADADDWVLYIYGRKTDRQRPAIFSKEIRSAPSMDFVIPAWLGRRLKWVTGLRLQVEWSASARMYRLRGCRPNEPTPGVKLGATNRGRDLRCTCFPSITVFELYAGESAWYPAFAIDGDALCLSMAQQAEEQTGLATGWKPNLPGDWVQWLSPESRAEGTIRVLNKGRQVWVKKSTVEELGWQEIERVRVGRMASYLYIEPAEAGYKLSRGNNGSRCVTCSRALSEAIGGKEGLPSAWNAAYTVNGASLIVDVAPPGCVLVDGWPPAARPATSGRPLS